MIVVNVYSITKKTAVINYKPVIRDMATVVKNNEMNTTIVEIMYPIGKNSIREKEKQISIKNILDTIAKNDKFVVSLYLYDKDITNNKELLAATKHMIETFGFVCVRENPSLNNCQFIYNNTIGKKMIEEIKDM